MKYIDYLFRMPIWECEECGSLYFSVYMSHCEECGGIIWNPWATDTLIFEAVGQEFHRDTGYVRPGKDCLLYSREERKEKFEE